MCLSFLREQLVRLVLLGVPPLNFLPSHPEKHQIFGLFIIGASAHGSAVFFVFTLPFLGRRNLYRLDLFFTRFGLYLPLILKHSEIKLRSYPNRLPSKQCKEREEEKYDKVAGSNAVVDFRSLKAHKCESSPEFASHRRLVKLSFTISRSVKVYENGWFQKRGRTSHYKHCT